MYLKKVLQHIQKKHQEEAITLVINHSYQEIKAIIYQYFKSYKYVSLKQKTNLRLLQKDPYKFFHLHDEKIIFDHIEVEPKFIELLLNYSMGIYRKENYLLISKVDMTKTNEQMTKIILHPFLDDEFELIKRIFSEANLASKKKVYTTYLDFVSSYFEDQVNIHKTVKIKKLIQLLSTQLNKNLNVNQLAKSLALSQPTVQKWILELERLGVIILLHPLEKTYGKRNSKTPKVYFKNTGFLCTLLGFKETNQLISSPLFFDLMSNFYLLELIKAQELESTQKKYTYWRESNGHEVKFILHNPTSMDIFDFTSSHEVLKQDLKELDYFDYLSDGEVLSKTIIYDGYQEQIKNGVRCLPWRRVNM